MSNFDFIRDLSESRLVPMKASLHDHDAKELAELAFLHIIALRIMLAEKSSERWAKNYCSKTIRGGNFLKWRSDGTDLYIFLHALTSQNETLGDDDDNHDTLRHQIAIYPGLIFRWLGHASTGMATPNDTKKLFARLDTMFRITNGSMRAIRRLVQDWPELSEHDCRLAMTRLLQFLRTRAPKSDILSALTLLAQHRNLEIHGVCNLETGNGCGDGEDASFFDGLPVARKKSSSFLLSLLPAAAGAAIGYSLARHHKTQESASSGSTSAANIAVVPGGVGSIPSGIGAGFDDDYSKSIYPAPKNTKPATTVVRRPPLKG